MTDLAPEAVGGRVWSPLQRWLHRLAAADADAGYRAVCRVALDGEPDPGWLLDRAGQVIRRLLAGLGEPVVEPVVVLGREPYPAAGLRLDPGDSDGQLTLVLPAHWADESTLLAVTAEILGAEPAAGDATPHVVAARWWDETARSESGAQVREFWRRRAAGWHDGLPDAFGGAPGGQVPHLAAVTGSLDGPLLARLPEPAEACLLAAWQVVLRRHADVHPLVLGVATELRRHPELRSCLGPLTAYLPLRAETGLEEPFAVHCREAANRLAEGRDRAEWFDWAHRPDGDSAGPRAGFAYSVLPDLLPGTRWPARVTDVDARTDRHALRLVCRRRADRIAVQLEYDPAWVASEVAGDLLAEFRSALTDGVDRPDRPARRLELLPASIRARIAARTTAPARASLDEDIMVRVRATAARKPHAIAVRCAGETLTYSQLVARVHDLADRLRIAGAGPEVPVGVQLGRGIDLMVGLVAVLEAGAGYVYLDPEQPARRRAEIVADCRIELVVGDPAAPPASGLRMIDPCASQGAPAALTGPARTPRPLPDQLGYVLYTSGSAGRPKGVMVTRGGMLSYLYGIADDLPVGGTALVSTSPGFDLSLPALYLPLLLGGAVVLLPPGPADVAALADAVTGPDCFDLVRITPSQLRALHAELAARAAAGRPGRVTARLFAVGGEPLPLSLVDDWRAVAPDAALANYYGPTETVGARTRCRVPADPAAARVMAGRTATVPLGEPVPGTALRLLDSDASPVAVGRPGELYIGGTGLARGYFAAPGATAERFVPDPWGPPGARMYRTGDVVRWLPGDRAEFVGRHDDQVKVRGHRVEPAEAAAAIREHPAVRDAVVVGRPGPDGAVSLVGYVVAGPEGPVPVDELRRYLAQRVPDHLLPAAVVWLDSLPLTANGKVDRAALPDPDGQRPEQSVAYLAPRTPVERALAELWAEVLGLERVGIEDNFFALGGDSILSILVIARAAKRGLKLSLPLFFQHQTVAAMAPFAGAVTAPAGAGGNTGALGPVQRWFFELAVPRREHWNQGWLFAVDEIDPVTLAAAVGEVQRWHPALHTRYLADPDSPGGWRSARVDPADQPPAVQARSVSAVDWPASLTDALRRAQEMDLDTGALLRVVYLDGGPGLRRLAFIAHHLAVDAVSWQIIFEDLRAAYAALCAGEPVQLPEPTTPPDEWATALAGTCEQVGDTLDYWLDQSPPDVAALPVDNPAPWPPREADRAEVHVALDPDRTDVLLRRMPAHTRADYALLAAVALAVGEWTGHPYAHVLIESQGRAQNLVPDVELYRSVGWFTAHVPLLLRVPDPTPAAALRAVAAQVHAIPHEGLSYGVLRYLDPHRGGLLAERPSPQIAVNYVGRAGSTGGRPEAGGAALSLRPAHEPLPPLIDPGAARSRLWGINAGVRAGSLHLVVDYAGRHYAPQTARRLAERIVHHLGAVIDAAGHRPDGEPAQVDFPLVGGGRQALDTAIASALARAPRPAPAAGSERRG